MRMLLSLVLFCILGIASIGATPAPIGSVLYINSEKSGQTHLEIYNFSEDKKIPISPSYNNVMYPKLSSDGKMIAFTKKEAGMKSEVILVYPAQNKVEKILDNAAFEGFSPSGKFLLYTSCDENVGLYIYDIAKKTSRQISKDSIFSAAWSNDSKWIAASVLARGGKSDLIRINLSDFKVEKLTDTPGQNEAFPLFTADGKYLVFYAGNGRNTRISYLDYNSGRIMVTPIIGKNPSMSPDNFWVVYERDNQIYISDKDGNSRRKIAEGKTPVWIH